MYADTITKAADAYSMNMLAVCYGGLQCCMSHVNVSDASHRKLNMCACADRISVLLAYTSMEKLRLTTSHLQALASRLSYIKCNCTERCGILSWLHMMGPCIEQLSEPVDSEQHCGAH